MTAVPFKNARIVRSSWLEEGGRRLDCNPYMSGAMEAREALRLLAAPKQLLSEVTTGIFHAGREGRRWVSDRQYGVPFLGSTDILSSDLSDLPLISKKQVKRSPHFLVHKRSTLITRSGTIGRMTYVRPDMDGMACSEHVLRVVPNNAVIHPGYLYAFLTSRYGVPLIVSGTYGAIIQHIEPEHIGSLPVPRFEEEKEKDIGDLIDVSANNRSSGLRILDECLEELESEAGFNDKNLLPVTSFAASSVLRSELNDRFDAPFHCASAKLAESMLDASDLGVALLSDVVLRFFKPPIFKRLWVDGDEHGRLFVSGNDIYRFQPEERRYVSHRTPKFDEFILKKNCVIFQAAGQIYGLFGRPLYVSGWLEGTFCADDVFRIVPKDDIDGAFLYLFLRTKVGQVLIKRLASGNSIPRVWEPHIAQLRVLWPDRSIRERYALRIIEAHELIDFALRAETTAISDLEKLIEQG